MSRDNRHPDPMVQAIAAAMAEKRRELIARPISAIWGELAEVALAEILQQLKEEK